MKTQQSDETAVGVDSNEQTPGDESWIGPELRISHGFDRYWAGFVGSPLLLPAIAHPRAREAALEVVAAQDRLRALHEERHARVAEYATLIRTGTAEDLMRHKHESERLDAVTVPDAEQAVNDALQAFSATFWSTRGETMAHISEELLPARLRAAQASVGAAVADLRALQELEKAYSGDGLVRVDQHDDEAYKASNQRAVRRRAVEIISSGWDLPDPEGHVHGLSELIGAYAEAMTPPEPVPAPETVEGEEIDFTEPGTPKAWEIVTSTLRG